MKASIFDLDGTLSNSIPHILCSLRRSMEAMGISPDDDFLLSTIGSPLLDVGEQRIGKGKGEEFLRHYQNFYEEERVRFPFQAFPGTIELLQHLKENDQKTAIVTSKQEAPTREVLKAIGIAPLTDTVISFTDTEEHKPLPAPVLLACERLGVEPKDAFMVGDSLHDLFSGKAAGCVTVAVTWGAMKETELSAAKPDFICHSMADLGKVLTETE